MESINFTWLFLFLLVELACVTLAGALLISVMISRRRDLAGSIAGVLLLLYILWTGTVIFSVLTLLFLGWSTPLPVRIGGALWVALISVFYFFCEVFPVGSSRIASRLRVASVMTVSAGVVAFAFLAPFVYERRVIDGIPGSRQGLAFLVVNGWVGILIVAALIRWVRKRTQHKVERTRQQLRRFIVSTAVSLLLGIVFAVLLPVLGEPRFFFLGTAAPIFVVIALIHAALFERSLNIAAFSLGLLLRAGIGVLALCGLYCGYLLFAHETGLASASRGLIVLTLLLALAAVGAQAMLFPWVSRILVWETPPTEDLVNGLLRITARGFVTPEDIKREIVSLLYSELKLKSVVLVAESLHGYTVDARPADAPASLRTLRRPLGANARRTNTPSAIVLSFLDHIVDIEATPHDYFQERGKLSQRYRRLARFSNSVLASLRNEGYSLALPLVFHDKLSGFLAVGPRSDGRPFLERDLRKLNAVRLTTAMMIEHAIRFESIHKLRERAEGDARRLAEALSGPVVRRREIRNKTLVYRSEAMQAVMDQVAAGATNRQPVLITGETGTGKELIANLIHEGADPEEPFVAVNCGAIPEALWEDEIFGHVQGAFTDARSGRSGRIREAGHGTLFLDELGEMPMSMQVKLLRVLQEREYTPIGGSGTEAVGCRFIFATNRDLMSEIGHGRFRKDLYYRVNVLRVELPPLRRRKVDIPALARHLIEKMAADLDRPSRDLDAAAVQVLMRYDWPGNVRELENVLLRAVLISEGPLLTAADLPDPAGDTVRAAATPGSRPAVQPQPPLATVHLEGNLQTLMGSYEGQLLEEAMRRTRGNKTHAAELLGIKRSTLRYKLKALQKGGELDE